MLKKIKKWDKFGNRLKKGDYSAYETEEGELKTIHSRVGEKKYGYDHIPKDFVIHHIDGDKNNNQYYNLILLHRKDHRRIHIKKTLIIRSKRSKEE